MLEINDEINRKILEICPENVDIYIVGGYIRDVLLKKECFDRDYAIKGQSAIEFAKKIANIFDGYFVLLDKTHDIARVVLKDKINTLDFAGCVGQDIYSDLKNRDYTINSIACRLKTNNCELIDPLNGKKDIENNIVKAISEENLKDDPLRLLRAFRIAAQFGFTIEKETLKLIKRHSNLINNVAIERVNSELIKLFSTENTAKNLILMKDTGLLFEIFPEMIPQTKVPPNLHHHLCLIDHSIETVRNVEENIKNFPVEQDRMAMLKIAAFLHDIGKPDTWTIDENGRHRFIKHEEIGGEKVLDTLKRLKFRKKDAKYISMLIKNHLYPSQLIREGIDSLSNRALMRFLRRINEYVPDLLVLAMADRLSARGPEITSETVETNINGIYALLEKYKESSEEIKTIPKLVSGEDVIEILNIPKGPKVGKVLSALKEAQISGDINTREEALDFIKNFKFY